MSDHTPTSEAVIEHPEPIPGYTYGTDEAATSPLSLQDLERLKEAVWLMPEDKQALREAAEILADQADDTVTGWRARLRDLPFMRPYSGHPDGTPNPEYGAATKPRFDRFIIDACTSPLDQDCTLPSGPGPTSAPPTGDVPLRADACLTSLTCKARTARSGRPAAALPVACGTERTLILVGCTAHSRLSLGVGVMLAARPASRLDGPQHRRRR
jgi:hypothetical protein